MSKLLLTLFNLQLLTLVVSTESTQKKTDDLYYKFHQSDYDLKVEWGELIRFKKPEVKQLKFIIFKYNRTCPVTNMTWEYNFDIGHELEMIFQLYKFASNEYRLFPLRVELNYCTSIENNLFGMARIKNCGNFTGCPLIKNRVYHSCNWTPDQSQFPPLIPSGRYMLEVQAMYRNKELWVGRAYGEVSRRLV